MEQTICPGNNPLIFRNAKDTHGFLEIQHLRGNDEGFGLAKRVEFCLNNELLNFPVKAKFLEPPAADIGVCDSTTKLAVEVTRVTWSRLSEISAHLPTGSVLDLDQALFTNDKTRRDDYRNIRGPGQKLSGDGWSRGEAVGKMLEGLASAIDRKSKKFDNYAKERDRVWLFLIDFSGYPGALDRLLQDDELRQTVGAMCRKTKFERIVIAGTGKEDTVTDLTAL